MPSEADRAGEWLSRQGAYFSDDCAGAECGYMLSVSFDLRVAVQKDNDLGYARALNGQFVSRLAVAPLCEPQQVIEGGGGQVGKNEIMKRSCIALQFDRAHFPENKQKLQNIDGQKHETPRECRPRHM